MSWGSTKRVNCVGTACWWTSLNNLILTLVSSESFCTTSSFFCSKKMTVSMDNKNEEEPTYLMLLPVCTFHWEKTSQMTQEDYHHLEGKTWTIQSLPLMTPGYRRAGADPGFFLGGGALVSCSTSTPVHHIVFFCVCRIPIVLENRKSSQGGGGAHPLHPPPRSAPGGQY